MSKVTHILAASLFLLALALWFLSPVVAAHYTTPLHKSFPVVNGQQVLATFVPRLSESYYVAVEFERNLPFARLEQIVGPVLGEPTSRPTIDWYIESQGQRIELRNSRSQNWGRLVGFTLGSFDATSGERYTLTAKVRSAEPDIRQLNGQLFVSTHPATGEKFYFRVLAVRALAIILTVFGLFIVAYGRSVRKAASDDTASRESE